MAVEAIEATKSPRNDLKLVSAIEMTHMYGARGSLALSRQKNTIKLLPQSAEKVELYGE